MVEASKLLLFGLLLILSIVLFVHADELEAKTNTFFEEGNDSDLTAYKRNRWRSSLKNRKTSPKRKQKPRKKPKKRAVKKPKQQFNASAFGDDTEITPKKKAKKPKKRSAKRKGTRLCVKPHYIDVRNDKGVLIKVLKRNTFVRVIKVLRLKNVLLANIGKNQFVEAKYLHSDCNPLPKRTLTKRVLRQAMNNLKAYLRLAYHNTKFNKPICRVGNSNRFMFKGKRGASCYRITPKRGWKLRSTFLKYALESFEEEGLHPADFVKYAYETDKKQFFRAVRQYYMRSFVLKGRCERLPTPAFHLCTYFAARFGPEHTRNYLIDIGMYKKGMNKKRYALDLNARNRKDLIRWSILSPIFEKQLQLSFARDSFVNQFKDKEEEL